LKKGTVSCIGNAIMTQCWVAE